jgi:hypothetical protein
MKSYRRHILNAAICLVLPQGLFLGCSLIGLGIGAISDGSSNRYSGDVSLVNVRKLEPGSTLTIITRDSKRIEGDYVGVRETLPDQYRAHYREALETLGMKDQFPFPGDTIRFAEYSSPATNLRGIFMGVDPSAVVVSRAGLRVGFFELAALRSSDGAEIDLQALEALVSNHQLPFVTRGILVSTDTDTIEVPFSDIIRIDKDRSQNGKLIGFGIGAAIDITILILASQEHNDNSCGRPTNQQSCNTPTR